MIPFAAILVRILGIAAALGLWFWTQKLIAGKALPDGRIGDRLHDLTGPANAWFASHERATNALLIATSLFIDLFGIYLLGSAVLGPTIRPFVALIMVFALRQLCQSLCSLPYPKGTIWRDPGFPSLLVTYGVGNDFYFSGHTAVAVVGAIELARGAPPWLAAAGAVVAVGEMAAVIVLRAHYLMDVFTAVFVAWGCDSLAVRVAPAIDAWLRHMA
jgi:hypothetical protein